MNKKGIISLVSIGLLSSLLSISTVKAEVNDYEVSKRVFERQAEKPLKKGIVDSNAFDELEKEIEDTKSYSTKSSNRSIMSFSDSDDDYIFEQEYNDDFNSANVTSYDKPTIGQLLPFYDLDFHKVTVPSDGVLIVGGDTNSYAIDLFFMATEKDWEYSGKLEYLGTEYEDDVEFQLYQAKAGTYYIPVFDNDNYDNTEEDLYAIVTGFIDNVAPSKPTVNKVDNNDRTINGKAEPKSMITVKSGSKVLGTAKTTSKGPFAVNIPVQKAGTKLTITAKDSAGNVSPSVYLTVADVVAPYSPRVNKVDSNDKVVTGMSEASSKVIVRVKGKLLGSANATSKGSFSVKIKAQKEGTVLSVTAKDKAGNVSKARTVKVVK